MDRIPLTIFLLLGYSTEEQICAYVGDHLSDCVPSGFQLTEPDRILTENDQALTVRCYKVMRINMLKAFADGGSALAEAQAENFIGNFSNSKTPTQLSAGGYDMNQPVIKTVTQFRGRDIANFDEAGLLDAIRNTEAEIASLKKVTTVSEKLNKQIADMEEALKVLATAYDAK
mgnify:CR=1 FL=1